MKLKAKYNRNDAMIEYKLDARDGDFCLSSMPATVAEEIVKRADALAMRDEKGFELLVNGEMMFPISIFDFEDGEKEAIAAPAEPAEPAKAKRAKAPKQAAGE